MVRQFKKSWDDTTPKSPPSVNNGADITTLLN